MGEWWVWGLGLFFSPQSAWWWRSVTVSYLHKSLSYTQWRRCTGLCDGRHLISDAEIPDIHTKTEDETELQLQLQTEGQRGKIGHMLKLVQKISSDRMWFTKQIYNTGHVKPKAWKLLCHEIPHRLLCKWNLVFVLGNKRYFQDNASCETGDVYWRLFIHGAILCFRKLLIWQNCTDRMSNPLIIRHRVTFKTQGKKIKRWVGKIL